MGPDGRTPDKLARYARERAALYGIDVPWEVINHRLAAHMAHQKLHLPTSGLMQIVRYGKSDMYIAVKEAIVK
jgi:hypothetical protein